MGTEGECARDGVGLGVRTSILALLGLATTVLEDKSDWVSFSLIHSWMSLNNFGSSDGVEVKSARFAILKDWFQTNSMLTKIEDKVEKLVSTEDQTEIRVL